MMATLRRFIALLLARTMERARSHGKTGTHFSGSRSKPGILVPVFDLKVPTRACRPAIGPRIGDSTRAHGAQKGSPVQGPGTLYSLRRNIVRNRRKTMRCLWFG